MVGIAGRTKDALACHSPFSLGNFYIESEAIYGKKEECMCRSKPSPG